MRYKSVISTLFAACLLAASAQAAVMFQLDPVGGAVAGNPGETVGWGFTLANDTDFLVVTSASFVPTPLSAFGSFEDYISTGPLLVVGPSPESPSVTQAFSVLLRTGVGAFHISPTAKGPVGGSVVIHYSLFSVSPNDPNFDPDVDTLVPDGTLTARAAVDAVPEPGSFALVGIAALVLGLKLVKAGHRSDLPRCG